MNLVKTLTSVRGVTQVEYSLLLAVFALVLIPAINLMTGQMGYSLTRLGSEISHASGGGSNSTSGAQPSDSGDQGPGESVLRKAPLKD